MLTLDEGEMLALATAVVVAPDASMMLPPRCGVVGTAAVVRGYDDVRCAAAIAADDELDE